MKLSCLQENLSKSLNIVGRITPIKSSLPVLGNILLETKEGRLKLSSTNLEIGISVFIGGKIEKEGSITIPSRLITEYINSLPNDKINLQVKDLTLNIECKKNKANIKGIDASEFPLIPKIKEKPLISINSKILSEAITNVVFATALDESRPVLSGVFLNFSENKLKMVATDSYRLAEKVITLSSKIKEDKKIIVPTRTMQELNRILGEFSGSVDISFSENQILFQIGDVYLISRLIEGSFPSYEQIIPKTNEIKAVLNLSDFIEVVKTVNLFAREAANNVKINIRSKGEVEITSQAQIGDVDSIIEAKVTGPDGEIAFNVKYLLDGLTNIKSQKVSLEINGKLNPGVLRPIDGKDYVYIIMPLKI